MPQLPHRPAAAREEVVRHLSQHGIAATEQRVRIGELLFACDQHLTADQIIERLRRTGARVSKATVYNTLNLFAARGLVRQINVDATRACFDSNVGAHHHFHNVDTGELRDVAVAELEFRRMPELPPGTELAGVDIVIRVRSKA
jgi:Fur family transcriptional regulator, iron response regulator